MSEVLSQEWENEARIRYKNERAEYRNRTSFGNTSFGRFGNLELEVRDFLRKGPQMQNVLCVGVGARSKCIRPTMEKEEGIWENSCGTYPFEISAALEGLGKNYAMTLIDLDQTNLNLVRSADTFSVEMEVSLASKFGMEKENNLQRYLQDTEQTGVGENYSVKIPRTFKEKRESGEIKFVHDDIVTSDLSQYGPFDFAHCLNVFMHLPLQHRGSSEDGAGRKILTLVLHNLIRNLKKDGILLVDNIINDNTRLFVSTKYEIEETFEERSLARIEKVIDYSSKGSYVFIRKM